MKVTIRDVARKLNLSITTVSRALDGYDDVAEETRSLVMQAAQEMGYVPNRAARMLRRQRSDTIGYILPAEAPRFYDPFFSEFIAGLADEAAEKGFDLLVSTAVPGVEDEVSCYKRWMQERKVDGFVLNRVRVQDWRIRALAQQGMPFVTLERSRDEINYPSIEVDGAAGMKLIIRHLVGLGFQRIAYLGGPEDLVIQADRFEGYCQGLGEVGLPVNHLLIGAGDLTRSGGYEAARDLLGRLELPAALVCVNDLTAIGALHAAHERGLVIGQELAVSGFDGIDETAHTEPPLTTLNQPLYQMARKLVGMLTCILGGQLLAEPQVCLQPELVVRASTERR